MKKVVIIGLPNCGKSTIFSRLIGNKAKVSIYPGSAVEIRSGVLRHEGSEIDIIDLPGIYNLFSNSDREQVVRKILLDEKPEMVIQVADAKNLKRSLLLTALLGEIGVPLVLVLNMVDEALQRGINVKRHRLETLLGVPVIETVASEGVGVGALLSALDKAARSSYPSRLPAALAGAVTSLAALVADQDHPEWAKRALALFACADEHETARWARERGGISGDEDALRIISLAAGSFYRALGLVIFRANDLSAEALYEESVYFISVSTTPLLNRLGDLALAPVAGTLILFILLTGIYFVVGKFAAGFLVDFLVKDFFGNMVGPPLKHIVAMIPSPFVQDILMGEYGLYSMALIPAFGLVLPVIVVFFFAFGFIEDSGYISRLSILLNKLFRKIGLNGKAVLPMVLGFSCVTMATLSTRILDSKKERFIAIFLLSLGVPCSAKLSMILVILAQVSFAAFFVVFGVVFSLTITSGFILSRFLQEESSHFIMEIPQIRFPSLRNVLTQTCNRSMMFLREALPLFVVSALGLFFMEKIGMLRLLERIVTPLIKGFLGLPPQFAESLIMGFIRGEAGIAVLKKMVDVGSMNHLQLVVAMIVTILFIPCVTNLLLIIKEQGVKKAVAIVVSVTLCAIMTGGIMNHLFLWRHVTF